MSGQLDAPAALPPGKPPVSIEQEVGWAPWRVWMLSRRGNPLAPAGIETPDRPAHSLVHCFKATVPRGISENKEILKLSKKTFAINLEISRNFFCTVGNTAAISVAKQLRLCFLLCKHFYTQGFHLIWKKHCKDSSVEESWGNTRLFPVLTTLPRCL